MGYYRSGVKGAMWLTHTSKSASEIPHILSTDAQVMPEIADVHLLQDAVVPGAAVPGGATRYLEARLAERLIIIALVNNMTGESSFGDHGEMILRERTLWSYMFTTVGSLFSSA